MKSQNSDQCFVVLICLILRLLQTWRKCAVILELTNMKYVGDTWWVNLKMMLKLLCDHLKCWEWHQDGTYTKAIIFVAIATFRRVENDKHQKVFSHYPKCCKTHLDVIYSTHWNFETAMNGYFDLIWQSFQHLQKFPNTMMLHNYPSLTTNCNWKFAWNICWN